MSRADKLRQKFLRRPPPKDFTWAELLLTMDHFGFDLDESGGGSHKHFVMRSDEDVVIDTYRPHPNGIMYAIQLIEIAKKLKSIGLIT